MEEETITLDATVGSRTLEIGTGAEQIIIAVKADTPIKIWTKAEGRVEANDDLKHQALEVYVKHACDPLKRAASDKGKGVYIANMKEIYRNVNPYIQYKGEKFIMQNLLSPDTVAQWLAFKGLSGQGKKGLLAIVDDATRNEEKSREKVHEKIGDIMDLATRHSKED